MADARAALVAPRSYRAAATEHRSPAGDIATGGCPDTPAVRTGTGGTGGWWYRLYAEMGLGGSGD